MAFSQGFAWLDQTITIFVNFLTSTILTSHEICLLAIYQTFNFEAETQIDPKTCEKLTRLIDYGFWEE